MYVVAFIIGLFLLCSFPTIVSLIYIAFREKELDKTSKEYSLINVIVRGLLLQLVVCFITVMVLLSYIIA